MTDFEIATFFMHWICHARETKNWTEFRGMISMIKNNNRFKRLPELYQGQIEGFFMGLIAEKEGMLLC